MTSASCTLDLLSSFFDRAAVVEALTVHEQQLARHGDHARWQDALNCMPAVRPGWIIRDGWLHAGAPVPDPEPLRDALREFVPWRKGPLVLGGQAIETEWRSDWKWDRVAPHIDLSAARVLDVGAGNGYFGWRMLAHGADLVLGCDPTPLFALQHAVIRHFTGPAAHALVAMRLEDLPAGLSGFDAVFSMGVLYHRRDPGLHLAQLRRRLRPGGLLVLETLVLPDAVPAVLEPVGRYAGMRNVHALPSLPTLLQWLDQAGFSNSRCVDVTITTAEEQHRSEWMPFHSLSDALDPADPERTIEGLPRPRRAMLLAWV